MSGSNELLSCMLTKEGDKAACRRESKNSTGICRTFRSGLYASAIRAYAGEEQTAGKRCFDAKLIRANSLIIAFSSWEQFLGAVWEQHGKQQKHGFSSCSHFAPKSANEHKPRHKKSPKTLKFLGLVLEAPPGIEPGMRVLQTRALPLGYGAIWSGKRGSNPPPQPWQGCALPNELFPQKKWCLRVDLNHRHRDFQSLALPTELPRHIGDPEGARTPDLQRDRLAY